jgi:hypothetical protein
LNNVVFLLHRFLEGGIWSFRATTNCWAWDWRFVRNTYTNASEKSLLLDQVKLHDI